MVPIRANSLSRQNPFYTDGRNVLLAKNKVHLSMPPSHGADADPLSLEVAAKVIRRGAIVKIGSDLQACALGIEVSRRTERSLLQFFYSFECLAGIFLRIAPTVCQSKRHILRAVATRSCLVISMTHFET